MNSAVSPFSGPADEEDALRALLALYLQTYEASEIRAAYRTLGSPRVEVDGLDEEIRSAILREYGSHGGAESDPRWAVERICAALPPPPDQGEQLRRATTALAAADLAPEPPVSCGEERGTGRGTFHLIRHRQGAVEVSTLGPFVCGNDGSDTFLWRWSNDHDVTAARAAFESAGFRWVDRDLGSIEVSGLSVYSFGRREPLSVGQLLFYWQS
ncbi:hypothetical protein [Streptomyces sp. NPDC059168]|uniref:hypothetical protein n=1 Tax=Streptomyces sp. NPDC059168 TaxID=3346753 RepID=UPI00368F3D8F